MLCFSRVEQSDGDFTHFFPHVFEGPCFLPRPAAREQ
jgi:hypothetical protein